MSEVPSTSEAVSTPADASVSTATESTQGGSTPSTTPVGDESGAKGPASVFDAVNRALKGDQDSLESSPTSETGKVSPNAEEAPLPDEVSPEELSRYHSRTRRRVQQLLDKNKAASTELGQLKPLAERMQRVDQFVASAGLSADEVSSGFEIMKLLKNSPFEAREKLLPIMQALDKLCGFELPPEIQTKVSQGLIDQDTAAELAQSRAQATLAHNANARTVEQIEQAQANAAHQRFTQGVNSAIQTYESNWRKTDPDHAAKATRVQEKVEITLSRMAQQGKQLSSPAEAVKIIEDARKAVEAELKPFLQKREAISPLPNGSLVANGTPKPRSMADAVAMGLRA